MKPSPSSGCCKALWSMGASRYTDHTTLCFLQFGLLCFHSMSLYFDGMNSTRAMQVVVDVLQKCLRSECLLMWSAEDTFDTSEGCMQTFHILEVLGSADGIEVSPS